MEHYAVRLCGACFKVRVDGEGTQKLRRLQDVRRLGHSQGECAGLLPG